MWFVIGFFVSFIVFFGVLVVNVLVDLVDDVLVKFNELFWQVEQIIEVLYSVQLDFNEKFVVQWVVDQKFVDNRMVLDVVRVCLVIFQMVVNKVVVVIYMGGCIYGMDVILMVEFL